MIGTHQNLHFRCGRHGPGCELYSYCRRDSQNRRTVRVGYSQRRPIRLGVNYVGVMDDVAIGRRGSFPRDSGYYHVLGSCSYHQYGSDRLTVQVLGDADSRIGHSTGNSDLPFKALRTASGCAVVRFSETFLLPDLYLGAPMNLRMAVSAGADCSEGGVNLRDVRDARGWPRYSLPGYIRHYTSTHLFPGRQPGAAPEPRTFVLLGLGRGSEGSKLSQRALGFDAPAQEL